MARSQNGYSANDINLTSVRTIPGTARSIRLRKGAAGDLLLWVLSQFDALVEDIDAGQLDDWGYAERPIRGGTELSNHASGTAADANAVRHPLGTDPAATFSKTQISTIRAIVARTEGCVRWGGDYSGRKDPMHFEIITPEPRCAAVLHKLTAAGGGGSTPGTAPADEKGLDYMRVYNVTPPDRGEHPIRVRLPGGPNAKIIVRPAVEGDKDNPVYIGNIYAWGSNNTGIGNDPKAKAGYDPRTTYSREFALPGALWADVNYSSARPFEIEVTG